MIEGDIKIIRYIDGEDRIVKVNEDILTEQEIVDLLVEYMEENKTLTLEIEDLNHYTKHLNKRIEHLKVKRDRERNSTLKQHLKWDKEAQTKIKELSDENEQLKKELHISDECETISIENSLRLSDEILELKKENEQLKSEIEKITKDKEQWAFISDCSIQVMNEEEKFKEDYLRIATNELKKLQEENEQLKQENKFLSDFKYFTTQDMQKTKNENKELKQKINELQTNKSIRTTRISKVFK